MRSMRRAIVAVVFLVVGVGVARPAAAQTVDVLEITFFHSGGDRPIGQNPTWVSYSDCIKDDILNVDVLLTDFASYNLEVWATSTGSCQDIASRQGSSATCWLVYQTDPNTEQFQISFRAQDLAAQNKNNGTTTGFGPGTGTLDDCEQQTDHLPVSLYFMLVDSGGNMQGTSEAFATGVDLIGPAPPTGLSAGVGEDLLIIEWEDGTNADDLNGYRAYCDPPPGGSSAPANTPTGSAGGAAGASSDAATDATTQTDGGDASASGGSAGTDAGTGGTGGSGTGGGGTGGGTTNPECPSALVSGERPNNDYLCGSTSGTIAGSIKAEDLTNGTLHAVAVAAVDDVGNSGVLSEVVCGTPQPVDDFFELYRRAGGKGGGGFCQIAGEPATGFAALLLTALAAFGIRRRTRR